MQITLGDWKAFSNWREEQLHAIYQSSEYLKITDQIATLEGLLSQPVRKQLRILVFVFHWIEPAPRAVLFKLEMDIKIAKSYRQIMLDRVYPRTFEGFLDWALLK